MSQNQPPSEHGEKSEAGRQQQDILSGRKIRPSREEVNEKLVRSSVGLVGGRQASTEAQADSGGSPMETIEEGEQSIPSESARALPVHEDVPRPRPVEEEQGDPGSIPISRGRKERASRESGSKMARPPPAS